MEGSGEGMVAVVQGLPEAGLAVTVMSRWHGPQGRRHSRSLINRNQSLPRIKSSIDNSPYYMYSTTKNHAGVQICDDRYASSYQLAHCSVRPTSPPVSVSEFPPQRSQPCRTQGNFEIGGFGSGELASAPISTQYSFRNNLRWARRGQPQFSRASCQTDPFVYSLRRYPNFLPSRSISADLIDRLIKHTQAKNLIKPSKVSKSVRSIPKEKTEHETNKQDSKQTKNIQTYTRTKNEKKSMDFPGNGSRFARRDQNYRLSFSSDRRTKSKYNPISFTYDYLKGHSTLYKKRQDRITEIRYLDNLTRYIKDTLQQICDDKPVTCPNIQIRYKQHRKNYHLDQSSHESNEEDDQAVAGASRGSTASEDRPGICKKKFPRGRNTCEHCRKPLGCPCIVKSPQNETSTSSTSFLGPSNRCQCQLDAVPRESSVKSEGVPQEDKGTHCFCMPRKSDDIVNDEYDKRFDEEIAAWMNELPVCANDTPENAVLREKLGKELVQTLKTMPRDENFDDNVKNEIKSYLKNMPIWLPSGGAVQEAFKNQLAGSLLNRVKEIPPKADKFTNLIREWVKSIAFQKDVDKQNIADIFVRILKPIALNRPETDFEYAKKLKELIIQKLEELPVDIKANRSSALKDLANKLIDKLVRQPKDIVKIDSVQLLNETIDKIDNWLNEKIEFINNLPMINRKQVKDLAKNLLELQASGVNDDVVGEIKNKIESFLRDNVGIKDMDTIKKLTNSLLPKFINDNNEEAKNSKEELGRSYQIIHNWLKKLPETQNLDLEKVKELSRELAKLICEGGKTTGGVQINISDWLERKLSYIEEEKKQSLMDAKLEAGKHRQRKLVIKEIDSFLDEVDVMDNSPETITELKEQLADTLINNLDEVLAHEVDENVLEHGSDIMIDKLFKNVKSIYLPDETDVKFDLRIPKITKKTLQEEIDDLLDTFRIDIKNKDALKTHLINALVDGVRLHENENDFQDDVVKSLREVNISADIARDMAKKLVDKVKEMILALKSKDSTVTHTVKLRKAEPSKLKKSLDFQQSDFFVPDDILKLDKKRKMSSFSEAANRLRTSEHTDVLRDKLPKAYEVKDLEPSYSQTKETTNDKHKGTRDSSDKTKNKIKYVKSLPQELIEQLKQNDFDPNDRDALEHFKLALQEAEQTKVPLVKILSTLDRHLPPRYKKQLTKVAYTPSPDPSVSKSIGRDNEDIQHKIGYHRPEDTSKEINIDKKSASRLKSKINGNLQFKKDTSKQKDGTDSEERRKDLKIQKETDHFKNEGSHNTATLSDINKAKVTGNRDISYETIPEEGITLHMKGNLVDVEDKQAGVSRYNNSSDTSRDVRSKVRKSSESIVSDFAGDTLKSKNKTNGFDKMISPERKQTHREFLANPSRISPSIPQKNVGDKPQGILAQDNIYDEGIVTNQLDPKKIKEVRKVLMNDIHNILDKVKLKSNEKENLKNNLLNTILSEEVDGDVKNVRNNIYNFLRNSNIPKDQARDITSKLLGKAQNLSKTISATISTKAGLSKTKGYDDYRQDTSLDEDTLKSGKAFGQKQIPMDISTNKIVSQNGKPNGRYESPREKCFEKASELIDADVTTSDKTFGLPGFFSPEKKKSGVSAKENTFAREHLNGKLQDSELSSKEKGQKQKPIKIDGSTQKRTQASDTTERGQKRKQIGDDLSLISQAVGAKTVDDGESTFDNSYGQRRKSLATDRQDKGLSQKPPSAEQSQVGTSYEWKRKTQAADKYSVRKTKPITMGTDTEFSIKRKGLGYSIAIPDKLTADISKHIHTEQEEEKLLESLAEVSPIGIAYGQKRKPITAAGTTGFSTESKGLDYSEATPDKSTEANISKQKYLKINNISSPEQEQDKLSESLAEDLGIIIDNTPFPLSSHTKQVLKRKLSEAIAEGMSLPYDIEKVNDKILDNLLTKDNVRLEKDGRRLKTIVDKSYGHRRKSLATDRQDNGFSRKPPIAEQLQTGTSYEWKGKPTDGLRAADRYSVIKTKPTGTNIEFSIKRKGLGYSVATPNKTATEISKDKHTEQEQEKILESLAEVSPIDMAYGQKHKPTTAAGTDTGFSTESKGLDYSITTPEKSTPADISKHKHTEQEQEKILESLAEVSPIGMAYGKKRQPTTAAGTDTGFSSESKGLDYSVATSGKSTEAHISKEKYLKINKIPSPEQEQDKVSESLVEDLGVVIDNTPFALSSHTKQVMKKKLAEAIAEGMGPPYDIEKVNNKILDNLLKEDNVRLGKDGRRIKTIVDKSYGQRLKSLTTNRRDNGFSQIPPIAEQSQIGKSYEWKGKPIDGLRAADKYFVTKTKPITRGTDTECGIKRKGHGYSVATSDKSTAAEEQEKLLESLAKASPIGMADGKKRKPTTTAGTGFSTKSKRYDYSIETPDISTEANISKLKYLKINKIPSREREQDKLSESLAKESPIRMPCGQKRKSTIAAGTDTDFCTKSKGLDYSVATSNKSTALGMSKDKYFKINKTPSTELEQDKLSESLAEDLGIVVDNAPFPLSSHTKQVLKRNLSEAIAEGMSPPYDIEKLKDKILDDLLTKDNVRLESDGKRIKLNDRVKHKLISPVAGTRTANTDTQSSSGQTEIKNRKIQQEIANALDGCPTNIPKNKRNNLRKKITDIVLTNNTFDFPNAWNKIFETLIRETHLNEGVINHLTDDIIDRVIVAIKDLSTSNRRINRMIYSLQMNGQKQERYKDQYVDDENKRTREKKKKAKKLSSADTDDMSRTKSVTYRDNGANTSQNGSDSYSETSSTIRNMKGYLKGEVQSLLQKYNVKFSKEGSLPSGYAPLSNEGKTPLNSTPKHGIGTPHLTPSLSTVYDEDTDIPDLHETELNRTDRINYEEYFKSIVEIVYDWVEEIPIDLKGNQEYKSKVVIQLAGDIFERQKYLQLNPDAKTSPREEIECLKYQVFKWMNNMFDVGDLTPMVPKIQELRYRLLKIGVPLLSKSSRIQIGQEPSRLSDVFINKYEDWIASLPLQFKSKDDEVQFEELQSELYTRLKELGPNASPETIRKEIHKFLYQCPLDPSAKIDIDEKINDLTKTVQSIDPSKSFDSKSGSKKLPNLLYDFIENWCENIPFDEDLDPNIKTIKNRLANKILQKICQLNLNPEILNDDFLYEDVLRDEVDSLIAEIRNYITIDDELLADLKDVLINKIKEAKQKTQNELAGHVYKQQLRDSISRTMPPSLKLSIDDLKSLEVLKDGVADAFINLNYSYGNDELKNKMSKKIGDEVTRFCNDYLKRHPLTPICTSKLNQDLYAALKNVSLPNDESMRAEVEHFRIKEVVTEWVKGLPIAEQTPTGQITLNKIISVLAKRLHDLESTKDFDDTDNREDMKKEIRKWLNKLPLLGDKDSIDRNASDLLDRLKSTEDSRKFDPSTRFPTDAAEICAGTCSYVIKEKPKLKAIPCPNTCMTSTPKLPSSLTKEDREHLDRIRERVQNARAKMAKHACKDAAISPCIDIGSQTDLRFGSLKSVSSICPRLQKPYRSASSRLRESPSCQMPCGTPRSGKFVCPGQERVRQTEMASPCMKSISPLSGSYDEVQPQVIINEYYWDSAGNSTHKMPYRPPYDYYQTPQEPRSPNIQPSPVCPGQFPQNQAKTSAPQSLHMRTSDQESRRPNCSRYYKERVTHLGSFDDIRSPNLKGKQSENFEWSSVKFPEEDDFWGPCPRPLIISDEEVGPFSRERERKEERVRCRCRERVLTKGEGKRRNRYSGSCHSCGNNASRPCSRCCAVRCPHPSFLYFRK